MQNLNKFNAILSDKECTQRFNTEMIPIFDKMEVTDSEPFYVPSLGNIDEYNSLFYTLYHGVVYKFFSIMFKKKRFSYKEYTSLYERYITVSIFNGVKTVSYSATPIIEIGKYVENDTKRSCEYIRPIYKDILKNRSLDKFREEVQKQETERIRILKETQNFTKKKSNINFDEFD